MRIREVENDLREMISLCKKTGLPQVAPIYITSKPGVGKSAIVRSLSEEFNIPLYDARLAQFAPEDLRGVPYPNVELKETEWFTPTFFPRKDELSILFLDELDKAKPSVQNAALQLLLDRRLGEYKLPDRVFIIAAGNTLSDNSFSIPLSSALNNRMLHIEMESDVSDWIKWATTNIGTDAKPIDKIEEDIIGFIQFKPDLMHAYNDKERAWPSPRTWEFLSKLLRDFPHKNKELKIINLSTMAIGESASREFHAYRKLYKNINPKDIIKGEYPNLIDKDISFKFAISSCLGFYVKNHGLKNKEEAKNCLGFIGKLSDEFKVIIYKLMNERNQLNNKLNDWCPEESKEILSGIFEKLSD